ncbi:MAG: peptidoglycan-binding protein, partial [Oceanicaulis sp.]
WSVKGIDPRARAIAKTAARKEGLTLGEWLNRVILDDGEMAPSGEWETQLDSFPGFGSGGGGDEDDALRAMVARLTDRLEAAEHRSTLALTGVDQSVLALSRRLDALEEAAEDGGEASDAALSRLRGQHEELLDRIRKLERQNPAGGADLQAMKAIEGTVGKLAGRLYETERDVRAELDNLAHKDARRDSQAERALKSLTERVEEAERRARQDGEDLRTRAEAQDKRLGEALSSLQDAARALQSRIIGAERETHRAAQALTESQERLDERLRQLEARTGDAMGADEFERRFDALGRELADLIRETRADCARQVAALSGKGDDAPRLERALAAAEQRLSQAEARQTTALTRIAEEVGRLSRAVDERIAEAERRLETKFSETETRRHRRDDRADMEARLDRVRQENASAVRKIGEQVAKLGENLSDRVSQAERRSAQAVEAAGERMAEVVEKLETRRGASEADLEDRIRASEERTAQRIEDAMKGVHDRLDQARSDTSDALSPVQRAMSALADRLEAIEKGRGAAPVQVDGPSQPARSKGGGGDGDDGGDEGGGADFSTPLPAAPGVGDAAWDAAREDDPGAMRDSFVVDAEAPVKPARAAAAATGDWAFETKAEAKREPEPKPKPARPGASADADFLNAARKTVRPNRGGWEDAPNPAGAGRGRLLLIGAGVLGFAAVAAAAGMLALEAMNGSDGPAPDSDPEAALSSLFATEPAPLAEPARIAPEPAPQADEPPAPEPETSAPSEPAGDDPAPFSEAGSITVEPVSLEAAARGGDAVARYQRALSRIEAGALQEAARLMARAAEQGEPAAMRHYAAMLRAGDGVAQDREAALDWMVRAAEAGNILAMHEAGGLHIGAGETPENQAAAARWFEQGALHGVRDSQFNMALLYAEGYGVPQSNADAYAWFTIAANAGDADAARRAEALRETLDPQALAGAQAAADSFSARPADPAAQGEYGPQAWDFSAADLVARAQALLGELGYPAGAADGGLGEQTRRALARFQRDAGLEPGAPLTPMLITRLERAAAS